MDTLIVNAMEGPLIDHSVAMSECQKMRRKQMIVDVNAAAADSLMVQGYSAEISSMRALAQVELSLSAAQSLQKSWGHCHQDIDDRQKSGSFQGNRV